MPLTPEELVCFAFALSSDLTGDHAKELGKKFNKLTTDEMVRLRGQFLQRDMEDIAPATLAESRDRISKAVVELGDPIALEAPDIYVCGHYEEGQVGPTHMWIEDRKNHVTYDTFNDVDGVIRVAGDSGDGADFRPGCETDALPAGEIVAIKVGGFTANQLRMLTENKVFDDDHDGALLDKADILQNLPAGSEHLAQMAKAIAEEPDADAAPTGPGGH